MSSKRGRGGIGLDYELSLALAKALKLKLAVTWFESEPEEESTPVKEVYAMLSYRLCDISPGFALYSPAYDGYESTRAALPRWDDRPDTLGRFFAVTLQAIATSAPYARMEIGLALHKDVSIGPVRKIRDLDGLRLGVEQGTLPGILTVRQGSKNMVQQAVTKNPGPTFLWAMENGEFEAALVTVGAFDFHLRQNRISQLILHDYRHPLGFNLGVAVLKSNPGLVTRMNDIIGRLLASGAMATMGRKSKMHFAAPTQPDIQPRLTMRDVLQIQ